MKFRGFRFFRSGRGIAVIAALLLILFLFRPGLYQLRNRIANSIGSALGRRVTLDNVRLHFLPRPGFDLEGLVIYDDPAFGAEPMIRAQEVSAAIRVRTLFRGRLEIATLSATEPSINLVRSTEGAWNLASVLERNAQIPAAPTGKSGYERRPAFPYLEASNARVNFKIGQTKKSYSLVNADVALWQESEDSWGARIKAEPVRTDFNLTDTGVLQMNAKWGRNPSLQKTPFEVVLQWQKGQVGQLTKLLSGKDRGWRGGVDLNAKLSGTPEALRVESRATVDDFHRYDIVESSNLRLTTSCSATYNAVTGEAADLTCVSPVGDGTVQVRGSLAVVIDHPTYDLVLTADNVPLSSTLRLLRRSKKEISPDLTASGLLNAEFHLSHPKASAQKSAKPADQKPTDQWTGTGVATNVHLASAGGASKSDKDELVIETVPLTLVDSSLPGSSHGGGQRAGSYWLGKDQEPSAVHLRFGPSGLAINAAAPVSVGGWISRTGYRFFIRGDSELKNISRLQNMLGVPGTRPAVEGLAKLDVSLSGPWQGFTPAVASGVAELHNVRSEIRGLNVPIEIASAVLLLNPDTAVLQKLSARIGDTRWTGNVTAPRHCASANCPLQFDLNVDQLSTRDLGEWFTPHSAKRAWYRILTPSDPLVSSPLLGIEASGNLRIGRFAINKMTATQVSSHVETGAGKITLTGLQGQLLRGTHRGNWIVDLSGFESVASKSSAPNLRLRGIGTLRDVSLDQVGALMNDAWVSGTADGKFEIESSGVNFWDLLSRSNGNLQFTMRNGALPHLEAPGATGSLAVHRFTGELRLKNGEWELEQGKLESHDGFYAVSGTASAAGNVNFVLTRGDDLRWNMTGTLAKPHLAPVGHTEAASAEPTATDAKP